MAEIFQNREQKFQHVGKYIPAHRMCFSCIAVALKHPIAGVQHHSVWLGLYAGVNFAVQKLGVFGRRLEGSHSPFYCHFVFLWILEENIIIYMTHISELSNHNSRSPTKTQHGGTRLGRLVSVLPCQISVYLPVGLF